eukprot:1333409-Alexandrium_andersonii.AAC.1
MDVEFADDTVLISRTAESATVLLAEVQAEARRYGLELNAGKTQEVAMNSDQKVYFEDGTPVPRVDAA